MIPREASDTEVAYWTERDGAHQYPAVIGGPEEGADVIACPVVVAPAVGVVHVAYQLDELEVARLAEGGTLWLTMYGNLPIHLVEVVARPDRADNGDGDG